MDIWLVVAFVAVILTSFQLLPQVYKSLRTRKVRDLSIGFIILAMLVSVSWLAYGIHLNDTALKIANSVNLVGAVILFVLKINNRG